jgi:transglutaminase-like putative cysteine protease
MQLTGSCELSFLNQDSIPMIFMLRPRSGAGQWVVSEAYEAEPDVAATEYVDLYGNLCQRILAPEGSFRIVTTAIVRVADEIDVCPGSPPTPIELVPDAALVFLLTSRYCQSDSFITLASEIADGHAPGFDQVEAVRGWVNANIAYEPGASNASTSAIDTMQARRGVCRDMAHLGIALTRALDIPARMVVGYAHGLEPMDLHAWFEAYIGEQWYTFDPKEPQTSAGRIVIAYGRDAADVAMVTQFGPSELVDLRVTVTRDDADEMPDD